MTSLLAQAGSLAMVVAEEDTKGAEFGKASPVGLLVIVLMLIAVFLLIRSMNKQLRKLPESFDTEHPEADQAFDEGTDTVDDGAATAEGAESDDDRRDPAHTPRSRGQQDESGSAS